MKVELKSTQTVKIIDYENGIFCEYAIENCKMKYYRFYNKIFKYGLIYIKSDETLEKVKNSIWSEHSKIIEQQNLKEKDLISFTDFDKLYYVGGHRDGMLAYYDGRFISTPIILDNIFFKCWQHIENTKEYCQHFLDSLNKKYIIDSTIVEIEYYNQDEDLDDHYTLDLIVKIPDDVYTSILGNRIFLDDICKNEVINFLKK